MNAGDFAKGMGIGVAIGTAVGVAATAPMKKKGCKTVAGRAMKAVGEVMASVAENMGM